MIEKSLAFLIRILSSKIKGIGRKLSKKLIDISSSRAPNHLKCPTLSLLAETKRSSEIWKHKEIPIDFNY